VDSRFGNAYKRHAIYDVARTWNQEHIGKSPFRVSVVDGWQLTDNRPETSSDGGHWIAEGSNHLTFRKGIGECDGMSPSANLATNRIDSILDIIFDDFITERVVI
jgi:hypothetical protein